MEVNLSFIEEISGTNFCSLVTRFYCSILFSKRGGNIKLKTYRYIAFLCVVYGIPALKDIDRTLYVDGTIFQPLVDLKISVFEHFIIIYCNKVLLEN